MSSPVCLVQRRHQSKCLFLHTISLQIHFKFPKYNYQHVSKQSLFPSETTVSPSGVGSPSSTNMGITMFHLIQNKSSLSSYIHDYIKSINNILSQKWRTCIQVSSTRQIKDSIFKISGRRNLNRGICHTPIFDLKMSLTRAV